MLIFHHGSSALIQLVIVFKAAGVGICNVKAGIRKSAPGNSSQPVCPSHIGFETAICMEG